MRDRTAKAQLIAAAESYAKVSPFDDACYRYYYYADTACHAKLSACLASRLTKYLQSVPVKYHQAVIDTALTELTYPSKNPDRPAFCAKDRAACMGVSRRQYYRIGVHDVIDVVIKHIISVANDVAYRVRQQLGKRKCEFGYWQDGTH